MKGPPQALRLESLAKAQFLIELNMSQLFREQLAVHTAARPTAW